MAPETKKKIDVNLNVFFFFNILLNYTLCHLLESPHGGDSNGTPQCIDSWNGKKYLKYATGSPFWLSCDNLCIYM